MRKQWIAVVLMALVAGCSNETGKSDPQSESSSADRSDLAEWNLNRVTTDMDGEVVSARRTYPFPNATNFNAEIACGRSKSELSLKIQSLVGNPESPSESSAFISESYYNQFSNSWRNVPILRVKIGEKSPVDSKIFTYFEIGDYSNEMKYSGSSLTQDIPMIVEAKNGTGTYQLSLDASNEVMQVLSACGKQITASDPPATNQSSSDADPSIIETANVSSSDAVATAYAEAAANASSSLPISPSFDCTKTETDVERLICDDATLSKLDASMAANYSAMLASNIGDGARVDLKSTQRGWMNSRNRCSDSDCLESSYRERLDAVCDYPVISGVHPECTYADDIE